jgi:hypothetical protein
MGLFDSVRDALPGGDRDDADADPDGGFALGERVDGDVFAAAAEGVCRAELVSVGEYLLRYRAELDDPDPRMDETAVVLALGTEDPAVVEAFRTRRDAWANWRTTPGVAFVGAVGDAPTPWLARRGDLVPLTDASGLSVRRRLAVVTEIAAAFDNVETGNGRHWDLAPGDVFLVDADDPIPGTARADVGEFAAVGDWGLRRAVLVAAGESVPVTPYDAPEQVAPDRFEAPAAMTAHVTETDAVDAGIELEARHADSKPWIDAYRFGAVAHEVLTGRPPFTGEDPAALRSAVLEGEPDPPTELSPGLPAGVDGLVGALLERDPSDRPMAGWVTEEFEELFEAAG